MHKRRSEHLLFFQIVYTFPLCPQPTNCSLPFRKTARNNLRRTRGYAGFPALDCTSEMDEDDIDAVTPPEDRLRNPDQRFTFESCSEELVNLNLNAYLEFSYSLTAVARESHARTSHLVEMC